jgi:hypothetical protein
MDHVAVPFVANERTMLEAWLDYHRATLLMKRSGLTDEQLKTNRKRDTNCSN